MISIVWDSAFKKGYQKKIKYNDRLKRKFWESMKLFSSDPFHRKLRAHKLTGKLQGLWAFSIDYETRVIFSFIGDDEILLIDIGSHEEVY